MNDTLVWFLAIALVGATIFFVLIGLFAKKPSRLDRAYYEEQWQRINRLAGGSEAEMHMAVLEADKLLDHALKARGFGGQTMGDRLKRARNSFRDNNAVWQSHKLRNRLAHESGTNLSSGSVGRAMQGFKSGLRDLGAL